MAETCAICSKNVNMKAKHYKLSGGRDGIACSVNCYNAYLQKQKTKPAAVPGQASATAKQQPGTTTR